MKRVLRAVKDTYITDRVIRDSFRATDANVGLAGTLDLFKLAGESTFSSDGPFISGTSQPIELSRVLIKFDLSPLAALTSSILDLNDESFSCTLRLVDVVGGQPLPSNFSLVLYPLAQSFDEGIGRDVNAFEDVDVANFLTASVSAGVSVWNASGADAKGYPGQVNIDVITGSTGLGDMFVVQTFVDGDEDMSVDITRIVSATLTGQLPDHGFRISFSGTQETDNRTRFVKRFATRHSTDPRLRPSVLVGFDDSVTDHHSAFYFDSTGSLHLNSFVRGSPANVVSGASLSPVTGPDCMILTLVSGNYDSGSLFRKSILASQVTVGANPVIGEYVATFAISPWESGTLLDEVRNAHSATFTEIWGSLDGTIGYYTGSIVVRELEHTAFVNAPDTIKLDIMNLKGTMTKTEKVRLRVVAQADGFKFKATKLPIEAQSLIYEKMYYRLVDVNEDDVIYDFDTLKGSTRLSTDASGMFFDLYISDLDVGRVYGIDILLDDHGAIRVFKNVGGTFRVE